MSSYRHPYRRNVWPDRDAEKREAARKAEEDIRKKNVMNDTNFPTLTSAKPLNAAGGNEFAKLAEKWAVDAEVDRRVTEHKKFQQAVDNVNTERIHARRSQQSRYARHDVDYEEDLAPVALPPSILEDGGGWTEVRRKVHKTKREMTVEEMDELDRQRQADASNDEFNGHLFESNRHDHDRV